MWIKCKTTIKIPASCWRRKRGKDNRLPSKRIIAQLSICDYTSFGRALASALLKGVKLMAKAKPKKNPARYVRESGLMERQVTIDGKRKVFRGHSDREINEKMLRYQTEQTAGPTLEAVAESWWAQKEAAIRPGTATCYKLCLQRILPALGSRRIRELTAQDIAAFLDKMRAQGLATKTMHNTHCVLNMIFEHWCAEFGGDANPSRLITTPTGTKTVRKPPSPQQQAAILAQIHSGRELSTGALAAAIMIYTGARLGEAAGLQWGDIDFKNKRLTICRAAEWNASNAAQVGSPKTDNGFRTLPLLPQLEDLLRPIRRDGNIFVLGGCETPITHMAFTCAWKSFCRDCGLITTTEKKEKKNGKEVRRTVYHPMVTPHQLRHCFATEMKKAGIDMDVAVRMMGHADSTMIRRVYMDIDGELLSAAGDQLAKHMADKHTRGTHDALK